jgi:hypothetical protein
MVGGIILKIFVLIYTYRESVFKITYFKRNELSKLFYYLIKIREFQSIDLIQ